jgi:amino acid permease
MVEMTTLMPVDGGFVSYASKYVDASMGLAIGWNYAITQWALICFELTSERHALDGKESEDAPTNTDPLGCPL